MRREERELFDRKMVTVFKIGDKVVVSKVHHAMNANLKNKKGRGGDVIHIGEGANKKVCVRFGLLDEWWIDPSYLDLSEDDA